MRAEDPVDTDRVTEWLVAWSEGDESALERLTPCVYRDLRRLAGSFLAHERPDPLLQPTVLVHEAFLRLVDQRRVTWRNRAHFLAVAARQMRRVLLDQVRRRRADKRGGGLTIVELDDARHVPGGRDLDLESLDDALVALERFAPRQGRVVELRYFGGLTIDETAEVLDVSPATVKLDWQLARAWLLRELAAPDPGAYSGTRAGGTA